ncbi:hydrogenase maturation protease [Sulfuracidifex metallicus]|uniref:Hydrogenase maturation protease n=2 Tax=Sulfuracidifex metallicus TaxID=47303 RepID=A0A6A9QPY6_SULME|nr:hydrogenase maturation protease [Sulfuracidifex metallicus]MUN29818.1 hydrogenase maturation protease [Sulfuracidifex metallicus DSM 6482 = JCM 9184]WOE51795.1 hydrogenase maturation protease [Sulfuracidifex metallicus DSM 6482 = JCM 9184]
MKILVVGVGNVFMKDDGCGSIMAGVLEGKVKGADVRDYGTGGISLTDELQSYDVVIILDVAAIDEKVKVFEVDDFNEDKVVETVLSI